MLKGLIVVMKSFLITLFCALQFTWMMPIMAQAETVKILALGDSLTAGYGLGPGDGFVDILQSHLDAKGFDVTLINAGVSGDTTKGGLARLDWALFDEPQKAIVALGGNDMLRGLSPEQSYDNLRAILQKLKDENIDVLLAGMLAPANMGADYQAEFDAIYPQLADEFDVIFYPFFLEGVALDPALNQPDGLHPNKAGVSVMADKITPYIQALIEKR